LFRAEKGRHLGGGLVKGEGRESSEGASLDREIRGEGFGRGVVPG
jgi:hypothetical protein